MLCRNGKQLVVHRQIQGVGSGRRCCAGSGFAPILGGGETARGRGEVKRRSSLILGLVGLQALALLVVLAITYLASQDVLLRYAEDLAARIARDATAYTEAFLDPADDAAALSAGLAESDVLDTRDRTQLTRYFFEILQARDDFEGLYYGDEAGNFTFVNRAADLPDAAFRAKLISTEPNRRVRLIWYTPDFESVSARIDGKDDFDPRVRPWYRAAMAGPGVAWTPPYIFFSAQAPGITASIPVSGPDGTASGVMGVDIGLAALSAFLDDLDISPRGSAAIVAESGDIIAHSDPELGALLDPEGNVRFGTVGEAGDPLLTRAAGAIEGGLGDLFPGEIRLARFEAQGETWLAAVQRLHLARTPWTVVTWLPEADMLAPLWRVRDTALVVAAIVLAVTAALGYVFVRSASLRA